MSELKNFLNTIAQNELAGVRQTINPSIADTASNRAYVSKHRNEQGIYYTLTEDGWNALGVTREAMQAANDKAAAQAKAVLAAAAKERDKRRKTK